MGDDNFVHQELDALQHFGEGPSAEGHTSAVRALAALPGERMVSGGGPGDNIVRVWKARGRGGWKLLQELEGHEGAVCAVTGVGPSSQLIASGGQGGGGAVKLWSTFSGEAHGELRAPAAEETDLTLALLALTDDTSLAAAGTGGEIRVWDCERQELVRSLGGAAIEYGPGGAADTPHPSVNALAHADGRTILAAGTGGVVRQWDPRSALGAVGPVSECRSSRGAAAAIHALAANAAGNAVASAGADGVINVWDLRKNKRVAAMQVVEHTPVWALAVLPNSLLVSGGSDNRLVAWDVVQGAAKYDTELDGAIFAIMPYGDGNGVWVGGEFHAIRGFSFAAEEGRSSARAGGEEGEALFHPGAEHAQTAAAAAHHHHHHHPRTAEAGVAHRPEAALLPSAASPGPPPPLQAPPPPAAVAALSAPAPPPQAPAAAAGGGGALRPPPPPQQQPLAHAHASYAPPPHAASVGELGAFLDAGSAPHLMRAGEALVAPPPPPPLPPQYAPYAAPPYHAGGAPPYYYSGAAAAHAPMPPAAPYAAPPPPLAAEALSGLPPAVAVELARLRKELAASASRAAALEQQLFEADMLAARYRSEREAAVAHARTDAEVAIRADLAANEAAALKMADEARSRAAAAEGALRDSQHELYISRSLTNQWSKDAASSGREADELRAALGAAKEAAAAACKLALSLGASADALPRLEPPTAAALFAPPAAAGKRRTSVGGTRYVEAAAAAAAAGDGFLPLQTAPPAPPPPPPQQQQQQQQPQQPPPAAPSAEPTPNALQLLVDAAGGVPALLTLIRGDGSSRAAADSRPAAPAPAPAASADDAGARRAPAAAAPAPGSYAARAAAQQKLSPRGVRSGAGGNPSPRRPAAAPPALAPAGAAAKRAPVRIRIVPAPGAAEGAGDGEGGGGAFEEEEEEAEEEEVEAEGGGFYGGEAEEERHGAPPPPPLRADQPLPRPLRGGRGAPAALRPSEPKGEAVAAKVSYYDSVAERQARDAAAAALKPHEYSATPPSIFGGAPPPPPHFLAPTRAHEGAPPPRPHPDFLHRHSGHGGHVAADVAATAHAHPAFAGLQLLHAPPPLPPAPLAHHPPSEQLIMQAHAQRQHEAEAQRQRAREAAPLPHRPEGVSAAEAYLAGGSGGGGEPPPAGPPPLPPPAFSPEALALSAGALAAAELSHSTSPSTLLASLGRLAAANAAM